MKKLIFSTLTFLWFQCAYSQVSGNVNYLQQTRLPENNIHTNFTGDDLVVSVKALSNVKAESYAAIFSLTQIGESVEEVHRIMQNRLDEITSSLDAMAGISYHVDMISFVPQYEYDRDKRIFNKDTYNEVPKGFELKKNLHVRYTSHETLDELVQIFAKAEVYELVRVDYFAQNLQQKKEELKAEALQMVMKKAGTYEPLLKVDLDTLKRQVADNFRVLYPLESYKSYQAYSSTSLDKVSKIGVTEADKTTTLYYQPVLDKEFDLVKNHEVLEPVIQILYEVKLRYVPKTDSGTREYRVITPSGELKTLQLRN